MSTEKVYILKISVTICFAIAVIAGIYKFRLANRETRLFLCYLIFALSVDLLTAPFFGLNRQSKDIMLMTYGMFESVFLFYFLSIVLPEGRLKAMARTMAALAIPLWILLFFFYANREDHIQLYDMAYNILVSLLSAYGILGYSERKMPFNTQPVFWFLLGTFLYSFCTFFINGLFYTRVGMSVWYLHNLVNLIAYLLFLKGFLSVKAEKFHAA